MAGKKNKSGGARPGAGRPKGSKSDKTLQQEAAQKIVREIVFEYLRPLVEARLESALGIYVEKVIVTKTGKIKVRVYKEQPNGQAIEDLLNRALGRPKDPSQEAIGEGIVALGKSVQKILESGAKK